MRSGTAATWGGCALLLLAATAGLAAPPKRAAPQRRPAASAAPMVGPITGPIAEYWLSADTSSGFVSGLTGANGRPSMGAMFGMMTGRNAGPSHGLTLQLGSTRSPSGGAPQADHFAPAALGVGASLPLVSPEPPAPGKPAEPATPGSPESYQRPKGRLLIYWGCGEHAGAGQPLVIDFSTLGTGAPLPDISPAYTVATERPPSPDRWTTYGSWPNARRQVAVPPTGSLVGAHAVRGDYSPDIAFDVPAAMDFMPPLDLRNLGASAEGGRRLAWTPAPQALGHHLMLIGAAGAPQAAARGRGRPAEGLDMVFWSSSAIKPGLFGGGLSGYLPPAEVRRLVTLGAVLPAPTAECVVPAEVAQASPMGLVTAVSYGPEQVWTDPPRPASGPWPISWRVKLRLKSTGTLLLGMPSVGGAPGGRPAPAINPGQELLKRFRPF